jgi:hypothetical protein
VEKDHQGESADASVGQKGWAELTLSPDVIVLEHHHRRQVIPMGVDAADEHAVLLNESEA